jgi:calcineurin-like phosphoesterase family protein
MKNKILFTSDTFFGRHSIAIESHKNIKTYNTKLLKNWNSKVNKNDIVYHLGNFVWDPETCEEILKKINGTIYLIRGEYDSVIDDNILNKYTNIKIIDSVKFEKLLISRYPLLSYPNDMFNIHGYDINSNFTDISIKRINVCTNQCNYTPLSLDDILNFYELYKEVRDTKDNTSINNK